MALFGGGGTPSAPPPPKVFPVDILATENAALAADKFGYNLSDADFAKRFPGLVASRNADMQAAYKEMTGPLAAPVQNQFVTTGLEQAQSAFGGGSEAPNITGKGSIGRNTVGASVGQQTQTYQDTARNYMDTLLSQNPQRAFGLSGGDLLNLAILNQGNLAQANQEAAGYASQVGAANAAANASQRNAIIGAGSSLAAAGLSASIAAGLIS